MKYLFLLPIFLLPYQGSDPIKVLFFGDSITEAGVSDIGYITQINQMFQDENLDSDIEFVGKGIGGNKVYDLYLRLEEDCLNHKPDIVVIYIGINDIWHKETHQTGTDLDKYLKFYQRLVDKIIASGAQLILCTPGMIGEKTDGSNPQDADLNLYSAKIQELALKNNLPLCDLRGKMIDAINLTGNSTQEKGILTTDRVHLNQKGNQLVAKALWTEIKKII